MDTKGITISTICKAPTQDRLYSEAVNIWNEAGLYHYKPTMPVPDLRFGGKMIAGPESDTFHEAVQIITYNFKRMAGIHITRYFAAYKMSVMLYIQLRYDFLSQLTRLAQCR